MWPFAKELISRSMDSALAEAKNIENMANQCLYDLSHADNPTRDKGQAISDGIRRKFSDDFQKCCLQRVVQMHAELVRRVQPVGDFGGERFIDEMYFHAEHNPTGIILSIVTDIGQNMESLCGALSPR